MAGRDSRLGVVVLGLDGFRLVAATEDDSELLMLVEATQTVVGCSGCGTRAVGRPLDCLRESVGRPLVPPANESRLGGGSFCLCKSARRVLLACALRLAFSPPGYPVCLFSLCIWSDTACGD